MFEGFSQRTIDFMWNLRLNNRKPWFEEHKDEYIQEFLTPMKELGSEVFERVKDTCGDKGFILKVSRIYKDARRLRGDGPYKDHLWLSIERPSEDSASKPVFWFELSPDDWTYGLGYYLAKPSTMAKLRARIENTPAKFEKLIAPLAKQDEFVLEGPAYKRRKEAPTPKTAEWYNKKSFSLIHKGTHGSEIFSQDLVGRLAAGYIFLMPLYDYFVTLDSDPEPQTD